MSEYVPVGTSVDALKKLAGQLCDAKLDVQFFGALAVEAAKISPEVARDWLNQRALAVEEYCATKQLLHEEVSLTYGPAVLDPTFPTMQAILSGAEFPAV